MINLTKLQDLVFWQPELKIIRAKIETLYESKVEIKKQSHQYLRKSKKKKKKRRIDEKVNKNG